TDWDEQIQLMRRYESRRLADVVCEKFGQFSPNRPNVLWVWGESRVMYEVELGQVMVDLRRRAEQRDAELFARHNFDKPADVIRHFQRLSAIVVHCLHEPELNRQLWWHNSDSRFP